MNRQLILIIHNVRSCHNVGALLRTADGLGIDRVYFTGYTPYPSYSRDSRLPHQSQKIDRQIHKTALGAEKTVIWEHKEDIETVINMLHEKGYKICALEQTKHSISLQQYKPADRLVVIVGREVEGIEASVLKMANDIIAIPMLGQKESFNVAQAAAMALYYLRFMA